MTNFVREADEVHDITEFMPHVPVVKKFIFAFKDRLTIRPSQDSDNNKNFCVQCLSFVYHLYKYRYI